MINTEKYQPARQNMKFVTRQADMFCINSHPDNIYIAFLNISRLGSLKFFSLSYNKD